MNQIKTLIVVGIVTLFTTFTHATSANISPIVSYLLSDTAKTGLYVLSGKTLYTTISDIPHTLESWTFNHDMTSVTWTELVGGGDATGTGEISVDGMTITYTCTYDSDQECEPDSTVLEIEEIVEDYLLVSVDGGVAQRLYFDEAKARAYFLGLESLIAGKTLYTTIYDIPNTLESWTFNHDMTSATWTELVGGNDSGTATLSVDGMSMTFTDSDGSATIVVTEILQDYMLISINGEAVQRLYYDEADARGYFLSFSASVPVKTISTSVDWDSIADIYTDIQGDATLSGLDITAIKMAHDDNNLYINLERAGLNFPSSDFYYNYWIYFRADSDTFSIENFHDNMGNHYFRIYKGIGYDGGAQVYESIKPSNTTLVNLELIVPKANIINTNEYYQVSLFTHGFKEGENDILGESEEDSTFSINF